MQRRDLLVASVGAFVAGAISGAAFGQPSSAPSPSEDTAAARRHDRERRFAETAFGRIAYIDRGTGPAALFLHCTVSRSAASSGAARSSGCPRIAGASHLIRWASVTPRSLPDRASHPPHRLTCSPRFSITSTSGRWI